MERMFAPRYNVFRIRERIVEEKEGNRGLKAWRAS